MRGIEEGSHHQVHAAVGRDHPHQAHLRGRRRACVVGSTLPVGRTQADHPFDFTRAQEVPNHLETVGDIAADTEGNGARGEHGGEPAAGKAAVEHEQVILAHEIEPLEQHLALIAHRFVQHEVEEQLDAWQIEAEADPFDDASHAVLHHRQAHHRAIGGDHPQAAPPHITLQRDIKTHFGSPYSSSKPVSACSRSANCSLVFAGIRNSSGAGSSWLVDCRELISVRPQMATDGLQPLRIICGCLRGIALRASAP